jgi:hypothetical protein
MAEHIHVEGKDIKPIWFCEKDSGSFEYLYRHLISDPFRFNGIWEISDSYFSAPSMAGRTHGYWKE